MQWIAQLRTRFVSVLGRKQLEQDLDDEFRDHLERETEANILAGMQPEEARLAARRSVGSIALYKEECRDERGIGFAEASARDLRYAFRMLRRTPLFTAVALATLAIGIGANTVIFTFIENILLCSLPVYKPGQLATVSWGSPTLSFPNYVDLRPEHRLH
jgi:hypothetical protein